MVTLEQQIKCAKTELERRQRVLPKLVEAGRLTEQMVTHEIESMRAIYQTLSQLRGLVSGK